MVGSSHSGTAVFGDADATVLLCIANSRDRSLLADRLDAAGLEVVAHTGGTLPSFDLCLVDTRTYPSIAEELKRRRAENDPVRLPVLLVLGPTDSEAVARQLTEGVDDVLPVPTSGDILQHRVDSLLRTRRQSKQLLVFNRAIEDAITGITIAYAGGDQELRYVNDAFVEITGYDREDALGRNCRFLQGPETAEEPVRRIREAIDAKEPVTAELLNYRQDGTKFWNHVEIAPVYGEDGVTHFVGFQQDITDRVERNRTLQRYERIVQAAGDPIYALDGRLRFTLVNDATVAVCEDAESELLGSPVETAFGDAHRRRLESAVLTLAGGDGSETTIETEVTGPNGRQRRYQTVIAALPGPEFTGVACVSRDITDDRERESRLSVLDRVLRHNIRNKLMVMLAQVDFIRDRTGEREVSDAADNIERAGEALLDLAETARNFEETVDPSTADTVGPVDIGRCTDNAIVEAEIAHANTEFVTDVPEELWAMAHGSFELAMSELLERAAESGDDVEVVVDVTVDAETGTATIRVSHDGEGIDEAERAALTAGSESDLQHATGLDLWFVRWMATNSGGTFTIDGEVPGTTIEITLPLADTPPGVSTRG